MSRIKSSLEYRRLEQLFFSNENVPHTPPPPPMEEGDHCYCGHVGGDCPNRSNNESSLTLLRPDDGSTTTTTAIVAMEPNHNHHDHNPSCSIAPRSPPRSPPQRSMGGNCCLQIGNLILQQLHYGPNIYSIDNFLTAAELLYFQQRIQRGGFQRSYVDAIGNDSDTSNNNINMSSGVGSIVNDDINKIGTEDPVGHPPNDDDDKNLAASHSPLPKHLVQYEQQQKQQHASFDNQHRTSSFLSFENQQDRVISAIEQRAAALLGCWSPVSRVEPLQLVRYQTGQFFGLHHDLGDWNEESGQVLLPPKAWYMKRRVATVFCYLNTLPSPQAGGETFFPRASDLTIAPQQGKAILFCNISADGSPDPRTIHAGNTVTEGTKYGLNIWISEA